MNPEERLPTNVNSSGYKTQAAMVKESSISGGSVFPASFQQLLRLPYVDLFEQTITAIRDENHMLELNRVLSPGFSVAYDPMDGWYGETLEYNWFIMTDLATPYITVIKEAEPLSFMISYVSIDRGPVPINRNIIRDVLRVLARELGEGNMLDALGIDALPSNDSSRIGAAVAAAQDAGLEIVVLAFRYDASNVSDMINSSTDGEGFAHANLRSRVFSSNRGGYGNPDHISHGQRVDIRAERVDDAANGTIPAAYDYLPSDDREGSDTATLHDYQWP
ncbi:hypothetical protein F5Y06DRAFT_302349 [Hypoxylon sp. FL0890]|nr:hypothetical protein F5Y06DRAFT_302349 [Hypoxylon sp. FL0890]